jgi:hypothetical protein
MLSEKAEIDGRTDQQLRTAILDEVARWHGDTAALLLYIHYTRSPRIPGEIQRFETHPSCLE